MSPEPDDLLAEQRGAIPPEAVIKEWEAQGTARLRRIGRLRSWADFLAAVVVLLLLAYFIQQTQPPSSLKSPAVSHFAQASS